MRRGFLLTAAFALALSLAFFPGCGDDDDNPADTGGNGNGNDTLTAAEILATIENMAAPVGSVSDDCPSMYILSEGAMAENTNEMFFMLGLLGADMTELYGTWEQTGTLFDTLAGMTRTSNTPANAVKILMTAADTMGTIWPADITIYEFDVDTNFTDMNMDIRGAIHLDDFPDSAYLDLSGHIETNAEGLEDLDEIELESVDITVQGSICDYSYSLEVEMTGEDSVVASGWFDDPAMAKTYFEATMKLIEEGGDYENARGTFSIWTTEAPATRFDMTMVTDPDTCVTGQVYINNNLEATMYVTDCDSEDPGVWIVIDGVTYDAEEYLEDLLDLVEELEGAELPVVLKDCCD